MGGDGGIIKFGQGLDFAVAATQHRPTEVCGVGAATLYLYY
jgi:hypothetical protein